MRPARRLVAPPRVSRTSSDRAGWIDGPDRPGDVVDHHVAGAGQQRTDGLAVAAKVAGGEVPTHRVLALPVDEQQMLARVVELEHVELPASRLTQRRGGEIAQRRAQLSAASGEAVDASD